MSLMNKILKDGCHEFQIEINDQQVQKLIKYKDILIDWNKKMNLTSIEEEKDVAIKHFLDSISCLKVKNVTKGKLIDVGTGAGFPGIPIKVMRSDIRLTLLDALNKRLDFLKEVCDQLDLKEVEFVHGRAEDYGQLEGHREQYDYAAARAVAPLNVLVEYCLPFVKVGGFFICQKGPQLKEELKEAKKAIDLLGGKPVEEQVVKLPFSDIEHRIVIIEKVKHTPTKYPRKAGKPSKNPIR
ncbi:16S rRNA (guanine(527)-N(7))-methyltransferase RsmG [Alkaliphilus peptidifermentans]|uniref:Ribosomal RNA small subunit methyltransferase G n=1 Tax=Alkaliphilus peptidifermentans DSM 18978 TaxID=1120976 RepID=A0A1G5HGL5_9FIRM|nr:16S rRNA (guanine(527)-N(7))-methyltransferase RsmG [Alkaliphilus peptidifermentans]SCY62811.1 16S rRNA m(7)G-527 methyltransferase [Alkaliphilus peptidifermentans DSM 18978]